MCSGADLLCSVAVCCVKVLIFLRSGAVCCVYVLVFCVQVLYVVFRCLFVILVSVTCTIIYNT